jgi:hypothetical protein
MKGWRGLVGVAVLAAGLGVARPAEAGWLEDAGWGSLTVLTNIVYMPAKLVYATLGGVTGGLAFALTGGSLETAETVWVTSMGGTYVVTPAMLRGEEAIAFTGSPGSDTSTDVGDNQGNNHALQEETLGTR